MPTPNETCEDRRKAAEAEAWKMIRDQGANNDLPNFTTLLKEQCLSPTYQYMPVIQNGSRSNETVKWWDIKADTANIGQAAFEACQAGLPPKSPPIRCMQTASRNQ